MGECVRGRHISTPSLTWPNTVRHNRAEYAELRATVAELASTFAAIPTESTLPRVLAMEWSMAWESELLETCRELEQTSETLASALNAFSKMLATPSLADVSAAQFGQLYRLAKALSQSQLPPEVLLKHVRLDALETALNKRGELLRLSGQTNQSLDIALVEFCNVLNASVAGVVPKGMKRPIYGLVNELMRDDLPPAQLVFHTQFDVLKKRLAERPALLRNQTQAFKALEARSFNTTLIDRIQVEEVERSWGDAVASFWPLSALKKTAIKKRLTAYMTPGGATEPEVDLPLLCEYRDSQAGLLANLLSLGLSSKLQAAVARDIHALDDQIKGAIRLRQAIGNAGLAPAHVGKAARGSLKPLVDAAHRFFSNAKTVATLRTKLMENLVQLGLPSALQAAVETNASGLEPQMQAAQKIREGVLALGVSGDRVFDVLQGILLTPEQERRRTAEELCRSARAFQQAWGAYSQQAAVAPVASRVAIRGRRCGRPGKTGARPTNHAQAVDGLGKRAEACRTTGPYCVY